MEFDLTLLISQYFNPEMMVAVPLLIFIGYQLKLSKRVDDTLIVNCLCYVGIAIACIYNFSTKVPSNAYEWFIMLTSSVLSGLVLAYTSVGVHQQLKQGKENKINKMEP